MNERKSFLSPISPRVTKNDSSCIQTSIPLDQHEDVISLLCLIADFLERSAHLKETPGKLREEIAKSGLLPKAIRWDGKDIIGSLPDFHSLRGFSKNHLITMLRLLPSKSQQSLQSSSLLTKSLYSIRDLEKESLEKSLKRDPITNKNQLDELLDARSEQRKLVREMNSERGRSTNILASQYASLSSKISRISRSLIGLPRYRKQFKYSVFDSLSRFDDPKSRLNDKAIEQLIISRYNILKKINGHRAQAYCISNQSHFIFTAADDGIVKLWNGQTGYLQACYRGHRNVVTDISTCKDLIASGSGSNESPAPEDNSVRIWEIGTTRSCYVITHHKKPVQRVEFSKDGSLLFTNAEDGSCCVWDMNALRTQIRDHDATIKIWMDREKERRRHAVMQQIIQQQEREQNPVVLEEDDVKLLAECPINPITLDPPLVFPHCDANKHIVPIVCMDVHPSGKYVVTGSEDSLGRVWSVDKIEADLKPPAAYSAPDLINGPYEDGSDHLLCLLSGHTEGFVFHVEWSHKGDRILTFSNKDGTARIWFWPLGNFASKPQHILLRVIGSLTNSKGPRNSSKIVPVIDGAAFSLSDDLVITTQSVKPLSYEPEEDRFYDSRVCIWDSHDGSLIRFIRGHRYGAPIVRIHPSLNWVCATGGRDGLIIFWDIESGKELSRVSAISPEGYPEILDANWSVNQNFPGDFIATDSMGRLIIIGTGNGDVYKSAPPEQFFSNERNELVFHHLSHEALDAQSQLPLYLTRPFPLLVDVDEVPYVYQPPPPLRGEGTYLTHEYLVPSSFKYRVNQALDKEKFIMKREQSQEESQRERIKRLDDGIADARLKDKQDQQNAINLTSKVKVPKSKPKIGPMLALERAADEAETSESEEEEEESLQPNGRTRRAAARRATTRIHRQARVLSELQAAASRQDTNDETFISYTTSRFINDDDEEEFEVDEEDHDSGDDDSELDFEPEDEDLDSSPQNGRYRTRHHNRVDYSALTDQQDDDYLLRNHQEEDAEYYQRKRKRTAPIGLPANGISDEWLTLSHQTYYFIPQRGDSVVYFPQGHADYLRHFPSTDSPPWHAWKAFDWVYVLCNVVNVDYEFPATSEAKVTICRVSLLVTQIKAPRGSGKLFDPYPETLPPISFQVSYHSFGFEFLVLEARFVAGVALPFSVGMRLRCFGRNEESYDPVVYDARLQKIQIKDSENWPDSPWESIECEWDEGGVMTCNPWDVQLNDPTQPTPKDCVSRDALAFLEIKVEDQPLGQWISREIDSCPLWFVFQRIHRDSELPCFITIRLVTQRLKSNYYRQWEAIEADFEKVIECAVFKKSENHPLRKKSEAFFQELKDILNFARYGDNFLEQSSSIHPTDIRCDSLKVAVMIALDTTQEVDKEQFFAFPPDLTLLPDYLEYVSQPMDFSTIRTRIQEFSFGENIESVSLPIARRFVRRVIRDIRLISENAMSYNLEGSQVVKSAKELLKKMSKEFSEIDFSKMNKPPTRTLESILTRSGVTVLTTTSSGRRVKTLKRNDGADSIFEDSGDEGVPEDTEDEEDILEVESEEEEEDEEDEEVDEDKLLDDDDEDEEDEVLKRADFSSKKYSLRSKKAEEDEESLELPPSPKPKKKSERRLKMQVVAVSPDLTPPVPPEEAAPQKSTRKRNVRAEEQINEEEQSWNQGEQVQATKRQRKSSPTIQPHYPNRITRSSNTSAAARRESTSRRSARTTRRNYRMDNDDFEEDDDHDEDDVFSEKNDEDEDRPKRRSTRARH